jgi:hypothetical protein
MLLTVFNHCCGFSSSKKRQNVLVLFIFNWENRGQVAIVPANDWLDTIVSVNIHDFFISACRPENEYIKLCGITRYRRNYLVQNSCYSYITLEKFIKDTIFSNWKLYVIRLFCKLFYPYRSSVLISRFALRFSEYMNNHTSQLALSNFNKMPILYTCFPF